MLDILPCPLSEGPGAARHRPPRGSGGARTALGQRRRRGARTGGGTAAAQGGVRGNEGGTPDRNNT